MDSAHTLDPRLMGAGVYMIINLETGERYIGQSKCIIARWGYWCRIIMSDLKNDKPCYNTIREAVKKYGVKAFSFEVLEFCKNDAAAIKLEKQYIKVCNPEYNRKARPKKNRK